MRSLIRRSRKPAGATLLVVASLGLIAVLTTGYATASWSVGRAGLWPAFGWSLFGSVVTGFVGVLAWGRDRWRIAIGLVLASAGLVSATVSLTLPFVMRSGGWRAGGGPPFELVPMLIFLVASVAVAAAGGGLVAVQEDRRSLLDTPAEGPASIQPGRAEGVRVWEPDQDRL